jgi:tRNA/rRNA methyltransferase
MAKLRGLLQRAQISSEEVALVRGMVRQLRWASERGGAAQATAEGKAGQTP